MTTRKIRTYSELKRLGTIEDRYRYLKLGGYVGENTFGFDRYINQAFYKSSEWRKLRWDIIARDNGCDLGMEGYEIHARPTIHHLNPMTPREIVDSDDKILNPEFLVLTCQLTHNAIHYGDESLLPRPFTPRRPGDTKLW